MSLRDEIALSSCGKELTILQFSLFYLQLALKRELTQADRDEFALMIMKSSLYPDVFDNQSNYQAGVLDYVAVTAAAYRVDYVIALGVFRYGENTRVKLNRSLELRFFYNTITPGLPNDAVETGGTRSKINWKAWLGRYPSVIAHFEFAAWRRPPLWRKIFWTMRVIASSFGNKNHPEKNLTTWMMVETAKGKSRICNLAIWIWQSRFDRQYPQGVQHWVSTLFSPTHPLAKYWST